MPKLSCTVCCCLLLVQGFAQFTISGRVADMRTGQPLSGATVQVSENDYLVVADGQGRFKMSDMPEGDYTLTARFLGFGEKTLSLHLHKDEWLDIRLRETPRWGKEIIVRATRVSEQTPMAFTTLNRKAIETKNTGRDMPFVLDQVPSLITTSDAGAGVGYTGLRIRGSDATRINVTLNGIPFNDSESHGVFWVNMPDIVSSAKSIQVQRGIGTSTNGAGAFGASININTSTDHDSAYVEAVNSYGSFNTHRHTLNLGTGRIGKYLFFESRLSLIRSDGFIDRAFSNLKSFYVSGKYQKKKTAVEAVVFGGKEITYQSWYGIPESRLKNDRQGMQKTALVEGWNTAQANNLLTSNSRKFNIYTYPNQVDNYQQDHYQLHLSHHFSSSFVANVSLHYTYGRGYFEEFMYDQKFPAYGLENPTIRDSSNNLITDTDLIRRRELDNHFYGVTYSAAYTREKYNAVVGGAWNRYQGAHFGKIIWAEIAMTAPKDLRYYFNQGDKYDFNIFWKNSYEITKNLSAFVDLQYRRIEYRAEGKRSTKEGMKNIEIDKQYDFFNPKGGLTYTLSKSNRLYASYSVASREPVRDDFINAPTDETPRPETVHDLEVGWRIKRKKYSLNVNGYWMRYINQRVLAGEINDVGASIRTGVNESYRLGVELEGLVRIHRKLTWNANLALSENKIKNFTAVLYDYGVNFDKQEEIRHPLSNVDISFSPSVVAGSSIAYMPLKGLTLALLTKYVGEQFLDNTSNPGRKVEDYVVNDLKLSYTLNPGFIKTLRLSVFINNLFDEQYESHGYTYGYKGGGEEVRQNYYYPQAGINYTVILFMRF